MLSAALSEAAWRELRSIVMAETNPTAESTRIMPTTSISSAMVNPLLPDKADFFGRFALLFLL